jgi:hypothetical protein
MASMDENPYQAPANQEASAPAEPRFDLLLALRWFPLGLLLAYIAYRCLMPLIDWLVWNV